jgi:hypothetical protein
MLMDVVPKTERLLAEDRMHELALRVELIAPKSTVDACKREHSS